MDDGAEQNWNVSELAEEAETKKKGVAQDGWLN